MRFRRSLLAVALSAPLIASAIAAVPGRSAATTPTKWVRNVVVIVTDHAVLDRQRLLREAQLVVDTRDALRGVPGDHGKVRML